MTTILAIESSCDETGVGIAELDADGTVTLLADEVASSVDEHARFGGVVPEIASRAHLEALGPTMRRALASAGIDKPDVVAATIGPGLAGALLVGRGRRQGLRGGLGGAVLRRQPPRRPPRRRRLRPRSAAGDALACWSPAGTPHLLHVRSLGEPIDELGSTVDDAAGEAYDKVARLLGLGYPGGKVLDDLARDRRPGGDRVPARHDRAPRRAVRVQLLRTQDRRRPLRREASRPRRSADVAAGFQEAVADVLTMKAVRAAAELGVITLLIAGGVAANSRLRELAEERCAAAGLTLRIPRPRLCTDNGAMIASFAAHLIAAGRAHRRRWTSQRPRPASREGAGGMTDKLEITELLYRYAELIDAGDFDGVGRAVVPIASSAARRPDRYRAQRDIAKLFAMTTRRYPDHRQHPAHPAPGAQSHRRAGRRRNRDHPVDVLRRAGHRDGADPADRRRPLLRQRSATTTAVGTSPSARSRSRWSATCPPISWSIRRRSTK